MPNQRSSSNPNWKWSWKKWTHQDHRPQLADSQPLLLDALVRCPAFRQDGAKRRSHSSTFSFEIFFSSAISKKHRGKGATNWSPTASIWLLCLQSNLLGLAHIGGSAWPMSAHSFPVSQHMYPNANPTRPAGGMADQHGKKLELLAWSCPILDRTR